MCIHAVTLPCGEIWDSVGYVVEDIACVRSVEYYVRVGNLILLCYRHERIGVLPRLGVGDNPYIHDVKAIPYEYYDVVGAIIGKVGSNPLLTVRLCVLDERLPRGIRLDRC